MSIKGLAICLSVSILAMSAPGTARADSGDHKRYADAKSRLQLVGCECHGGSTMLLPSTCWSAAQKVAALPVRAAWA